MSITLRAKRILTGALAGALVLGLLPAGVASAATTACEGAASNQFADSNPTHQANINCIAAYDVVNGFADGTFGGSRNITRAQMATFIANFAATTLNVDITDIEVASHTFTDVAGNVHADNIARIFGLGVTAGRTATTFAPNDTITRAEAATMLANAHVALGVDLTGVTPSTAFTDLGTSVHASNINILAGAGVVSGKTATTFGPSQAILRAEIATLLVRSITVLRSQNLWLAPPLVAPVVTSLTSSPELVSVTVADSSATQTALRLKFDEEVAATVSTTATDWQLVLWDGTFIDAVGGDFAPAKDSANPDSVIVVFDTSDYAAAVAVQVQAGAVTDLDTNPGIAGSLPLNAQTVNRTTTPQLISFGNPQNLGTATATVDFVFDQEVGAPDDDAPNDGVFVHVRSDGTEVEVAFDDTTTTRVAAGTNVANDTYRVTVGAALTQAVYNDIRRVYLIDDDTAVNPNSPQVVLNVAAGGSTAGPDVTSITIDRANNRVDVTFDTTVVLVGAAPGGVTLYGSDGVAIGTFDGDHSLRPDNRTVRVPFDANSIDDDVIIYATVDAGLVTATANNLNNFAQTVAYSYNFAAGQTAGPDLQSAALSITGGVFAAASVTFTFDEVVAVAPDASEIRFIGANGAEVTINDLDNDNIEIVQSGGNNTAQVRLTLSTAAEIAALRDTVVLVEFDGTATEDDFGYTSYWKSVTLAK